MCAYSTGPSPYTYLWSTGEVTSTATTNMGAGTYTLTVTHKSTLQGNVGGPFDPQSQDFSLILTGNNLTLGVEDNVLANNLVVFPNPSNGLVKVALPSDTRYQYQVVNMMGSTLLNGTLDKDLLDISTLPAGSYYLILQSEGQRIIRPIIRN